MNLSDIPLFANFGKHVPKILRRQLINQLIEKYVGAEKESASTLDSSNDRRTLNSDNSCKPSIQRFHCSLLFVDISGFTVLSQKLEIDDLKNHINNYFTKILDIVEKYGGEVVKFAGDALYIIWQTPVHSTDSNELIPPITTFQIKNNAYVSSEQRLFFETMAKETADKAVACGLEISTTCNNHKINLERKQESGFTARTGGGASKLRQKIMPLILISRMNKPSKGDQLSIPMSKAGDSIDESVAYLNVHSGVSMGLMAGLDVGSYDRWEYLLIGEPLNDVAFAESQAEVGEMVISPKVHEIIHPNPQFGGMILSAASRRSKVISRRNLTVRENTSPAPLMHLASCRTLSCGCTRTVAGYFKLHQTPHESIKIDNSASQGYLLPNPSSNSAVVRQDSKMKKLLMNNISALADEINAQDNFNLNFATVLKDEVMWAFHSAMPLLVDKFIKYVGEIDKFRALTNDVSFADDLSKTLPLPTSTLSIETNFLSTYAYNNDEMLLENFSQWVYTCLIDDLVRHVHEVARINVRLRKCTRSNRHTTFLEQRILDLRNEISFSDQLYSTVEARPHSLNKPHMSGYNLRPNPNLNVLDTPVDEKRKGPRPNSMNNTTGARRRSLSFKGMGIQESEMIAELRSVIVMFIKINISHTDLFVDEQYRSSGILPDRSSDKNADPTIIIPQFNFLLRSDTEKEADCAVLNEYQSCMNIMTAAFNEKGGHLRQFIVDDKGTVCIATFGLRGSDNDDNAAAAIEAAQSILNNLKEAGISASIGVTSGKAYCGLVGSPIRHEYAVMGPSTNLSARLMSKAPVNAIICDVDTRKRDRAHSFQVLSEVVAKGYVTPVQTFKPICKFNQSEQTLQKAIENIQNNFTTNGLLLVGECEMQQLQAPSIDEMHKIMNLANMFELNKRMQNAPPGHHLRNSINKQINFMTAITNTDYVLQRRVSFSVAIGMDKPAIAKFKLHGRSAELEQAIHFMFPYLANLDSQPNQSNVLPESENRRRSYALRMSGNILQSSLNVRQSYNLRGSMSMKLGAMKNNIIRNSIALKDLINKQGNYVDTFDTNALAKLLVLSGPQGMGKSSFLKALCQKLTAISKQDEQHNITVFYNPNKNMHSNTPFVYWRHTIGEMVLAIGKSNQFAASKDENEDGRMLMSSCIDFVISSIPHEMKEHKPLLENFLYCTPVDDNETTLKLIGQTRFNRTSELLAAIIQLYTIVTNRIALIALEELDAVDHATLHLLRHVWMTNRGVLIISSVRATSRFTSEIDINYKSKGGIDIFASFFESDRFLQIEIGPLDLASTKALINDSLVANTVGELDDETVQKLHELSGGNPLYAYEMTKAMVEKAQSSATPISVDLLSQSVTKLRSNRVEEVICRRFDQLAPESQLILKMGAVACVNGGTFSFDMLSFLCSDSSFIMESNSDDNVTTFHNIENLFKEGFGTVSSKVGDTVNTSFESDQIGERSMGFGTSRNINLTQTLRDILTQHEFIAIVKTNAAFTSGFELSEYENVSDIEGDPKSVQVDDQMLMNERFEFRVALEQLTIYNLLLDIQKESLHANVAAFLRKKGLLLYHALTFGGSLSSKPSLDDSRSGSAAEDFYEQGYHWQRATCWSSAMLCYYNAAMTLNQSVDLNDKRSYLIDAYKMLNVLRQENDYNGVGVVHSELSASRIEYLFRASKILLPDDGTLAASKADILPTTIKQSDEVKPDFGLTFIQIKSIVQNDADTFSVALRSILELAKICVELFDNPLFICKLYEEALEMLLLAKIAHDDIIAGIVDEEECRGDKQYFKDNEVYLYHIIVGVIFNELLLLQVHDEEHLLKSTIIIESYSSLIEQTIDNSRSSDFSAEHPSVASSSCGQEEYKISALCLRIPLLMELGRFDDVIESIKSLVTTYVYEEHSKKLLEIYPVDIVPYIIAIGTQYMIAKGDLPYAKSTIDFLIDLNRKIDDHPQTALMFIYPLCILLIFLHRYHESYEIYQNFLEFHYEFDQFSTIEEIQMLFCEWLTRLNKFDIYLETFDVNIFHDDDEEVDDYLLRYTRPANKIMENCGAADEYLSSWSGIYSNLYFCGCSMEYINASMCYLKLQVLCVLNDSISYEFEEYQQLSNLSLASKSIDNINLRRSFSSANMMQRSGSPRQNPMPAKKDHHHDHHTDVSAASVYHYHVETTKQLLKIDNVEEKLDKYYAAANYYLERSLRISSSECNHILILNTIHSHILNAQLQMMFDSFSETSNGAESFDNSLGALQFCVHMCRKHDLSLLKLSAGIYMEQLEVDELNGLKLQLEGLDEIRTRIGSRPFRHHFSMLLQIMPALRKYEHLVNRYRKVPVVAPQDESLNE